MKNVLYITYDGLTDPLGQSQILPYLQQLTKEGYVFTILSFEKRGRYQQEGKLVRKIVSAAGINWHPLFFTAKPPVLSKVYDRFRMQRAALALHKQKGFDLVHCRSYVAAEMGLLLKQKFGIKMLFDMRGFWADEKVDNGQWNLQNALYKRIYRHYKEREKAFLLQADGIVSLTHAAKAYLLQQKGYSKLSIDVIPCCADLGHFNYQNITAAKVSALKSKLQIPEEAKVITYLGSVGGWYMTKEMFRFFALLQKNAPEYVMLLLTKDSAQDVREEAIAAGINPDKLYITYASRPELPGYLALCNMSVFFIRNTFSKTASSPTKHAELMGMGIPVVCNDIGDTGTIINETKTGLVINEFDTVTLEKAFDSVKKLEQLDKAYIRQCAKELFDLESGVQKYSALYRRMLPKGTAITV